MKTYERQVEEMEQQIDDLALQLKQKEQDYVNLHQSMDFNSSFDIINNDQRHNGGTSESSNMQVQRLADENEYLASQIQSHQVTIKQQQEQIVKYQTAENLCQQEIKEKTAEYNRLREELQSKVSEKQAQFERQVETTMLERCESKEREVIELKDQIFKFKSQFEEIKNAQQAQLEEKELEIEKLVSLLHGYQL